MDAHHIFVNAGALMESKTPNQVIGVFAHETGHIVGGHLSKMRQELANAQTAAIIAMLLGAGALVAGARSNNVDIGNVGGALMNAPQSYLMHTLLSYQRAQEDYADRAGVRFLTMTGQSAKGMYDTFKRFADESMFESKYIDPYAQNHPMPQERMAALENLAHNQFWDKKDPPELQFRHDMMRAKLYGFMDRPLDVMRRYPSIRHQLAGALCPRHLHLSFRRSARRHRADQRLDSSGAQQSVLLRAQGPGAARRGAPGGRDPTAAARRSTRARPRAYSDHARPGARRHRKHQDGR